jgi:hypothetical protein
VFELLRQSEWHAQQDGFKWTAIIGKGQDMKSLTITEIERIMIKGGGETPEEAVAKLWLKLNQK